LLKRLDMKNTLLLAFLFLSGCADVFTSRPGTTLPAMATIPVADRDVVWERAIPVLLDEGYVPLVVNQQAGYISAKRREDFNDDTLVGTMATVVVTTSGVVRLEVSGVGYFHSAEEFQAAVKTRQQRLLSRILNPAHPAG
jgi:hypothetical protein